MNTTASEVLEFIRENDVKFVRLSFCDLFGVHKNIAIMSDELEYAFKNGISFDANSIKGFRDVNNSDLFLFPNPATISLLPWRPGPGRVARFFCDIRTPDGSAFLHDGRHLLRQVSEKYEKMGYICKIGAECEFYLFKIDEDGEPTTKTLDRGGYMDIAPLDKGENMRREICLTLEEMGITPESSHHERGPGQNEVDFKFSDALVSADNLITFKSVVKAIAARNGLFASFMPKPLPDCAGNGLHINISLSHNGRNIFKDAPGGKDSKVTDSFIAGIMSKTPEITLFLNPLANSYERFGAHEAPKYVSWSHQNRSQLVRIPAATGEKVRMELRSPDPTINPYLAFALIMSAGLEGVEKGFALPPAVDADLYHADESVTSGLTALPTSLDEAIRLARDSEFVKCIIGEEPLNRFLSVKEVEAADYRAAANKADFCRESYFFSC
ncbi:MAG: glutamine synthetase family protein [Oscillospiraceae bacterium]|nr:glutamine synthetase family protein [Oscillospiraceae bacterium]